MKSSALRTSVFALAVGTALAAAAIAATAPAGSSSGMPDRAMSDKHDQMGGPGHRGMRGGPMGMMDPFMMAVHRLELTPEQHQSVRSILDGARQSHQDEMAHMGENLAVLGNPGDPGYAAAVQAAKAKAAAMIQQRSDLDVQIYAVLTAEQKAKLPQLLSDMKTKFEERRDDWQKRDRGAAAPKT